MKSQKAKLVDELTAQGYNFESMAGYDRMLIQEENYTRTQGKWKKEAEEHPFWASGLSMLFRLEEPFELARVWGDGIGHSNADDLGSYVPMNVYEMQATNMVQTVRETVSDKIKDKIHWDLFGQNVAAFLYNTGMNVADSGFQKAAFGDVATVALMGCSSAAETTKRVIEQGGSNEQAFWLGLSAGAAELVVENFSVDNLPELKDARQTGGRQTGGRFFCLDDFSER